MTVYDLTEKVWNFRFGTWRGRETGNHTHSLTPLSRTLAGRPDLQWSNLQKCRSVKHMVSKLWILRNLHLHCLTILLYSTVNSVQRSKTFNCGKRSRGMLFLSFSTQTNLRHVFKMFDFGTHTRFESWMPLVNGCVNCALFNAVPKVFFIIERNE